MLLTEAVLIVHGHNKLSYSLGAIVTFTVARQWYHQWTLVGWRHWKEEEKRMPTGFIHNGIKFKVWERTKYYDTFIHIARIFDSILVQEPG